MCAATHFMTPTCLAHTPQLHLRRAQEHLVRAAQGDAGLVHPHAQVRCWRWCSQPAALLLLLLRQPLLMSAVRPGCDSVACKTLCTGIHIGRPPACTYPMAASFEETDACPCPAVVG